VSVLSEFREYFDGTREAKLRALKLAQEAERREEERKLRAQVGAIAASPVIQEFRETVLGMAGAVLPSETMDAAGAFWYRKGLEHAVSMLDETLARANED
jgi:hypothetical protein